MAKRKTFEIEVIERRTYVVPPSMVTMFREALENAGEDMDDQDLNEIIGSIDEHGGADQVVTVKVTVIRGAK